MRLCAHDGRMRVESAGSELTVPASAHRKPVGPGHWAEDLGVEGPRTEEPGEMGGKRPAAEKMGRK